MSIVITPNEQIVREGLRKSKPPLFVQSLSELKDHYHNCDYTVKTKQMRSLPGSKIPRTGVLLTSLSGDMAPVCGFAPEFWLGRIFKPSHIKAISKHLPFMIDYCNSHGKVILLATIHAERFNNRLRIHRPDGPAIEFEFGPGLYVWQGIVVPERIIMETVTVQKILTCSNQTYREILIKRLGVENFLNEGSLEKISTYKSKSSEAELYRTRDCHWDGTNRAICLLKVICPSTGKVYILRTAPWIKAAKEALEYSIGGNGINPVDYSNLVKET